MISAVIQRIEAQVPRLAGRLQGAAELQALMAQNALPQSREAGFVLPLGLVPSGRPDSGAGAFTQMVDEIVGVLLTFRHAGKTGDRILEDVRALIMEVIGAVAGWAPGATIAGVFRLQRAGVVRMSAGTLVYQIDFAISDQLRITS